MNYVFFDLKVDNKMLYVQCMKVNKNLKKQDIYINKVELNDKNEKVLINELIAFVKGCIVIGYDLSKQLITLLTRMYYLKIYDCTFHYFDMKDYIASTNNINSINDMVKLMKKYSDNNLDNIKYIKNKPKLVSLRVFRGLNYKLYLLDKGYYVYDKSINKMVSFYIHKKELDRNWNYTEDEYLYLKNNGANFVTNIFHISDDTIKYTNEYTIYSDNNLEKYEYMIEKIEKALTFIKNHPSLNIKLVCVGNIQELKENYKILGKEKLEKILKLITREKELWSKW